MDPAAALTRLGELTTTDSRELDRVCEEVAAALHQAGAEPLFTLAGADFATDPYLICADRYWRLRFLELPTIRTALACAAWLRTHLAAGHRAEVEQRWALGYAFVTKDSVESRRELDEAATDFAGSADLSFFAAVYHAGKLRANFCFDELEDFLSASLLAQAAGRHREDPVFLALRCFAAYGSRRIATAHAAELLERAWSHPRRSRQVVDLCLNALAAAKPFPGDGTLLRERAEEAVELWPRDHIFHFRLATGRSMCGAHEAALDSVDQALALLPATGTRGSHKLLQEQYLVLRNEIRSALTRAAAEAHTARRWEAQEAANRELTRKLETSTMSTVTVLTLFGTVISFVLTSVPLAYAGTLPLTSRLALLAAQAAALLLFAALTITATHLLHRRRTRPTTGER
ncbi:hypothetical protein ACFQLX_23995 [Streptomyces polyrhachis]|uniref:Tetratricopeptide repeat protein n=1 Tax=Streptomyces polyrhachis TaxID=1282885 RepID=A0ABW2GKC6_9ACTN